MILHYILFFLFLAFTQGYHHHPSLRAIPASSTRRRLIPSWPYAFLVSHVGFNDGQDWCITAKHGVTDGSDVGFDLCDFSTAPQSQLFLLDDVGKIHTKLDDTQCLVVDLGDRTDLGGARVKFCACNEPTATYNTFEHNRNTTVLRVEDDATYCIKQTGNSAQTTDTLRTELCDESDPCFLYDYVERNCVIGRWMNDVQCCDDTDCNETTEICQDYSCACSTSLPDVICCQNSDCPQGFVCGDTNLCEIEVPTAGPCNAECCRDEDCPTGYTCEANTCMAPATFLVSTIDNKDYCVSANRGVEEGDEVGSELCDFVKKPRTQLWHRDIHNKFRSDLNLHRCMKVGAGPSVVTGFEIKMTHCNIDTFLYDAVTDLIHLDQDPNYCLTTMQEGDGMLCGKPCEVNDETFEFTLQPL